MDPFSYGKINLMILQSGALVQINNQPVLSIVVQYPAHGNVLFDK
jgi:hypothetical protein